MFAQPVKKATKAPAPQRAATQRATQLATPQQSLQRVSDQHDLSQLLAPRLPGAIQFKLQVGAADDPLEAEADRVAEQVLGMQAEPTSLTPAPPQLSRKCAACDHEEQTLQREASGPGTDLDEAPNEVHAVLSSPGQPLDASSRAFFEPRFAHDFSAVRVHTDAVAQRSATAVNARAYTVGHDIVFGQGALAPHTPEGRRLLAHELAHVVQQGSALPVIRREACGSDADRPPLPDSIDFAANSELAAVRASVFDKRIGKLGIGKSGAAVALLQRLLLNQVCDGIDRAALRRELASQRYGWATHKAVQRFQATHTDALGKPLGNDGEVGPATLAAMDRALGLQPVPGAKDPEGTGPCFGVAKHGPGEARQLLRTEVPPFFEFHPNRTVWQIANFDIQESFVKTEHREFMRASVVPQINATAPAQFGVRLVGEASTTAGPAINDPLSEARAACVREALIAAGLPAARIESEIGRGENLARERRILTGATPLDSVEDRAARQVSIILAPSGTPTEDCNNTDKTRASQQFMVRSLCKNTTTMSVNIGDVSDPLRPTYREFQWLHFPSFNGCTYLAGPKRPAQPPLMPVITAIDMRLAIGDPDKTSTRSDFSGDAMLLSAPAQQVLRTAGRAADLTLFGEWDPTSCAATPSQMPGVLLPIGPVRCGPVPAPSHVRCETTPGPDCTAAHKMSKAQNYNGLLLGGTATITSILPAWARRFIDLGASVAYMQFGTNEPDGPPIRRHFIFAGGSLSASEGLDHVKAASAPEQDTGSPQQLATSNPNSWTGGSDFNKTLNATLELHGGSNRIDVETGAGSFTFYNLICNKNSVTYHGVVRAVSGVECELVEDLGLKERTCEDDECSEEVRTAGHDEFLVKVGRATSASLPWRAKTIAQQLGCPVTAAFVNVESRAGSGTQVSRQFALLLKEEECRYLVARADEHLDVLIERRLATVDPDPGSSVAPSDFMGGAGLNDKGGLTIVAATNLPITFDLPGAFDPSCKGKRGAKGLMIPLSAVECAPAPTPKHDTSPDLSHEEQCRGFAKANAWDVGRALSKMLIGRYDYVLDQLVPVYGTNQMFVDPFYREELRGKPPGTMVQNGVFIGRVADSGGGTTDVVGFADFVIVALDTDGTIIVRITSRFCAFDVRGNVRIVQPDGCEEGIAKPGQELPIYPARRRPLPTPTPPVQPKLRVGAVDDPLEVEADRVADQVLRVPEGRVAVTGVTPQLSRKCAACAHDEEPLRRSVAGGAASGNHAPPLVHSVLRAGGAPLDASTRGFFEPRFGRDLSHVRVHRGAAAEESAAAVNAHAYTVGSNIVFGAGRFEPATHEGRRLLAHELTHVMQQARGPVNVARKPAPPAPPPPTRNYDTDVAVMDVSNMESWAAADYWDARVNERFTLGIDDATAERIKSPEERTALVAALWRVKPEPLNRPQVKYVQIPAALRPGGQQGAELLYRFSFSPNQEQEQEHEKDKDKDENREKKKRDHVSITLEVEQADHVLTLAPTPSGDYRRDDSKWGTDIGKGETMLHTYERGLPGGGEAYWQQHPEERRQLDYWIERQGRQFRQLVITATREQRGKVTTTRRSNFLVVGNKGPDGRIAEVRIERLGQDFDLTQVWRPAPDIKDGGDVLLERLQELPEPDRLGELRLGKLPVDEAVPVKYLIWGYFSRGTRDAEVDVIVPALRSNKRVLYTLHFRADNSVDVERLGEERSTATLDPLRMDIATVRGYEEHPDEPQKLKAWLGKRYPSLQPQGQTAAEIRESANRSLQAEAGTAAWFKANYGIIILNAADGRKRLQALGSVGEALDGIKEFEPAELRMLEIALQGIGESFLSLLRGTRLVRQVEHVAFDKAQSKFTHSPHVQGATRKLSNSSQETIIIFDAGVKHTDRFLGNAAGVRPAQATTLVHELGHVIAFSSDAAKKFNEFVKEQGIRPFTPYRGQENPATPTEFFSEAYFLYVTDPQWLRAGHPAVFDWFEAFQQQLAKSSKKSK